ncbi:Uncharacterised protein [Mycobacteroides abscessus subsp. massiliense]|nr:Uncharacterised protein [Mycobacteroides abscessus subsp. massiliense]
MCSAIAPATTGPTTSPISDVIWKVASAVPALPLLPTTSATAACCGDAYKPAPIPPISESTTSTGSDDTNPIATTVDPHTTSPATTSGLRPMSSDHDPARKAVDTSPAANAANTSPAAPGR